MAAQPLHADVRFWRDPELPGVEARSSSYRTQAFRTHTHAGFSVGLVESGGTRFELSGRDFTARAGQLVVIEPEEPHACNPEDGVGISYRMFYLAPGWLTRDGQRSRFPAPVLDDPELFAAWRELHEAFIWGAPADGKKALLTSCLHDLIARHAAVSPADLPDIPAVAAARQHLRASLGARVPLAELAARAGLSPHHFSRVFKSATGLPPHRYQIQQAVEHAKALLAGGASICQTAQEAGFADQSHFSRSFREHTGATPRQYLESRVCDACPSAENF